MITVNSGLAPNPFFGVCSLGLCTPNHMNANLCEGDYLIGLSSHELMRKHLWNDTRIIYAMTISKVLGLDEYYKKYPEKRGNHSGNILEKYGDAIYREDSRGILMHIPESQQHIGIESQDIKGNRVFIGEIFWHFGCNSIPLPDEKWTQPLKESFRGIRYIFDSDDNHGRAWADEDLESFKTWLHKYPNGILGMPADMEDLTSDGEQNFGSVSCSS